ncbi:MAG: threonine/serine dehydratase [Bacillaceae bacterium]|nr:threonine/serine dehydratase [Bacillaceae bacterium]
MTASPPADITIRDIWEARRRIAPFVNETPLIPTTGLKDHTHADVYLKLENLHQIRAFKIRGAANKILSLTEEQRQRGVTTFSTGNHGLAVSYIARELGIRAVICVSNRVAPAKIEAIRSLGADIKFCGQGQDDAEKACYNLQDKEGLTVIKPFDDPHVIAGQGTIGLEIMAQLPRVDTVIIPLSGGGLLAGIALALKTSVPDIRIIGVSMEKSAVMHESLKAGKPIVLEEQDTLADSLLGGIGLNNRYTYPMVKAYIDQTILLPEDAIAAGMNYMLKTHKMIVEGAAATPIAAFISGKVSGDVRQAVGIITGSNVDLGVLFDIADSHN